MSPQADDAPSGDGPPRRRAARAWAHAAWARAATWVETWGSRLSGEPSASLAFLGLGLVALGYTLAIVAVRVWYEALGPYNVDTTIYWAIGHGILKGYAPYRDLWDIKPPGIFMLSALSYLVTGGGWLTHVTQVGSLVAVALSPLAYVLRFRGGRRQWLFAAPTIAALWALVAMMTAFVADTACEVQTETHALPGIVAYMLLIGVPGRWAFRGRALGIALAIGMKEPFLLVLPAVYLIMDPETRRPWADIWGPLLMASVAGALFLLVVGWLPAFIGLYLHSMVGSHIELFGSPFGRILAAFDFSWDRFRKYSLFLPLTLVYCCAVYLFGPAASATTSTSPTPAAGTRHNSARRFQILLVGVLLSSLAVGLSGHFYDHHFALMVPFGLAVVFSLLSQLIQSTPDADAGAGATTGGQPWLRSGLVSLAILVALVPDWVPPKVYRDRAQVIAGLDAASRQSAEVIDAVLDRLHLSRYLWLGPGGYTPFTYTRHVPSGPLFFQQIIFFDGHYPKWLITRFRKQLDDAKIVVFNSHMTGPLDEEVRVRLAQEFTPLPPALIPAGKHCQYPILIRKGFAIPP